MTPDGRNERYQPLALISITVLALLLFSIFFLSFLVAPLAILAVFYVGFAASDRAKRQQPDAAESGATERLAREARARQHAIERADEQTGQETASGPVRTPR
jgi:hypothetical protein